MGILEAKENKINILFVRFGTRAGIIGGGAARLLAINRYFLEKANIFMITHRKTFDWLKNMGLSAQPYYLEETNWTWRQNILEIAYCGLKTFLFLKKAGARIDWVYGFTNSLPDLLPALKARRLHRAKLAVYIQLTVTPKRGEKRGLVSGFLVRLDRMVTLRMMKKYADIIFVFNHPDKEELIARGIEEQRVKVINYGVDLAAVKAVSEPPKHYDGVFLGRFAESKGIFDLVEVWRAVCMEFPQARLAIIGAGLPAMVARLKKKIKKAGMESNILLFSALYGRQKYEMMKSGRVFLNPSYQESWCITIAEALACGLPAVAYYLDVYDKIYGDAVITVPRAGKAEFAARVVSLLKQPDLYRRQKEKGLLLAEKYDWQSAAEQELAYLFGYS